MLRRFLPDPLIIGLLLVLGLATLLPVRNEAATAINWLTNAAIVLLFFLHGAKLSREAVIAGIVHWRLHTAVLLSTFLMFPLLGFGLATALPDLLPPALWTGFLFLAVLPSTVQSSIAFTSIAGGNVSAAIAAASASQVAGVFLTPFLISLLAGTQGSVQAAGVGQIVLMVLVPFVAGHLLRPFLIGFMERHRGLVGFTDRSTILLAVYSAFSEAMVEGIWSRLPGRVLLILLLLSVVILAVALLFTWVLGRIGGFSREDRIAILFCGTKKSLVQGVPMGRILFAGPDLGLILVPVMVFHQLQLMVCAWIARHYAAKDS